MPRLTEPTELTQIPLAVQPCDHRDGFGSTIIFVQDKPEDGVCMLCDAYFPAGTPLPEEAQA